VRFAYFDFELFLTVSIITSFRLELSAAFVPFQPSLFKIIPFSDFNDRYAPRTFDAVHQSAFVNL
jgi:hypothetical protein